MLITHERCLDHVAGRMHPEAPGRLRAAWNGIDDLGLGSDLHRVAAEPADRAALLRVHSGPHLDRLEEISNSGGGRIDADTRLNEATWDAAVLAAGAGLQAVAALDAGGVDAVFCAIRPPGHHATSTLSMGFCFVNNVAVTAMALADRGERVMIVDYDAHHGNGTQDLFYADPRVLFTSLHQTSLYPGTGPIDERGTGEGEGFTINIPMPKGATGDHYRAAWDRVLAPAAEKFDPTWLLISAGFDGHRADPMTSLGLTSGDLGDLTTDVLAAVPKGRCIAFLEGGYNFGAVRRCTHAVLGALAGERVHPEAPTSGGPGADAVDQAVLVHGEA